MKVVHTHYHEYFSFRFDCLSQNPFPFFNMQFQSSVGLYYNKSHDPTLIKIDTKQLYAIMFFPPIRDGISSLHPQMSILSWMMMMRNYSATIESHFWNENLLSGFFVTQKSFGNENSSSMLLPNIKWKREEAHRSHQGRNIMTA